MWNTRWETTIISFIKNITKIIMLLGIYVYSERVKRLSVEILTLIIRWQPKSKCMFFAEMKIRFTKLIIKYYVGTIIQNNTSKNKHKIRFYF